MPYISNHGRRKDLWEGAARPATAAELNYLVCMYYLSLDEYKDTSLFDNHILGLIEDYVKDWGMKYATYNDIVGALTCARLEMLHRGKYKHLFNGVIQNRLTILYQDEIHPYELDKCKENGDLL